MRCDEFYQYITYINLTEMEELSPLSDFSLRYSPIKPINKYLLNICMSEDLSDVTFSIKNEGTRVRVPAHKLMLAIRSPVFKAMFYGPMSRSSGDIDITDIDYQTFVLMIRDIYTDEGIITKDNSIQLLNAAHKYELKDLMEKCLSFLVNDTEVENVCLILRWARHLELKVLAEKSLNFIIEKAEDVFNTDGFLSLNNDDLHLIYSRDDICALEENIIKSAIHWAEHQCQINNVTKSQNEVRKMLGPVIYDLRIPLLSLEQFSMIVVKNNILSEEEELGLYKFFTMTKKRADDLCGFDTKPRCRLSLFIKMNDIMKKAPLQDAKTTFKGKEVQCYIITE